MVKRGFDAAGASVALVLLSPLIAATAIAVLISFGRPLLFVQPRPGREGRVFYLRKFRSMRPIDPKRGWLTDEQRLTRFGKILRSTSLDELPSLWNVLRGDMSFVGPRPLLVEYLDHYTVEQSRRHEVRPGITGLAQISGRNTVDWEDRFALDVRYVDSRRLALDARILIATVRAVLIREGINAEDHATMRKFSRDT
ncbi:sugar transferase [Microbacterium aerolatum]